MALTVEDGSVVTGADSYISLTDADTYFTDRGSPTAWTSLADAAKESALRYATAWLDNNFVWRGGIVDQDQVLSWPRYSVEDDEGRYIDSDIVPQVIKDAVCEAALDHQNQALNQARTQAVKREKLDVMDTTYQDGSISERIHDYIKLILSKITEGTGFQPVLVRG